MTETATATNPNEASASHEASATLLAAAGSEAGNTQQPQNDSAQAAAAAEKPAEGKHDEATNAAKGAPEKYVFTAPEGTEYDPAVLSAYEGAAKQAGLTQDVAQKMIDQMAPALVARQADQVQAIHQEWREATASDKEYGGEKLQENLGVARKALDMLDPLPTGAGANGAPKTTPLRTLLEETGLGNHPELIRFMFHAGKALSEDKFVAGRSGAVQRDAVAILYDAKT